MAELKQQKDERIVYLDALRTAACFAVVMLHVSAQQFYRVDFGTRDWRAVVLYESLVNWAVPAFVMISGAAMLRKEYGYKAIFPKLLGIVRIFFIWSALYLISDILLNTDVEYFRDALWLQVFLQGHYHMWYLIMLFGLYLIVPILKAVVDRPGLLNAFVLLSLVFAFLIPSVKDLPQPGSFFGAIYRAFCNMADDTVFHLTLGYASYFVLGYALSRSERLSGKKALAVGLVLLTAGTLLVLFETNKTRSKEHALLFLQYYQLGIAAQTCGVMLLFKTLSGTGFARAAARLGPMTLGAYILHPFVLEIADKLGWTSLVDDRMIFIPVFSALVFSVSVFLSYLLLKTPAACIITLNWSRTHDDGTTKPC